MFLNSSLLLDLQQIITRYSHHETPANSSSALKESADELFSLLFSDCEDVLEEATRNVIAECLGKLSLSDPEKFVPQLQVSL